MEERTINGEVTVETKEEFLAALTHRPEVDGLRIQAPRMSASATKRTAPGIGVHAVHDDVNVAVRPVAVRHN